MKKYKTGNKFGMSRYPLISVVEIERESEHSVWINGRRSGKKTDWDWYHDSWEDAKNFLLSKANADISNAEYRLKEAQKQLGKVEALIDQEK